MCVLRNPPRTLANLDIRSYQLLLLSLELSLILRVYAIWERNKYGTPPSYLVTSIKMLIFIVTRAICFTFIRACRFIYPSFNTEPEIFSCRRSKLTNILLEGVRFTIAVISGPLALSFGRS